MASSLKGLHVALVGPIPPPAGGMANQTRKLREFLTSEGTVCTMVATNAPYQYRWIEKLKGIRAIFRLIPYVFALNRACKKADVMHVMANSGWSWHLFAAPAIVIARLNSTPVVINYRGGYAQEFFQKSWYWISKTLNKAQQIIVPSAFLQDVFAEWGKQANIVPNVLDTQLFKFQPKDSVSESPILLVARNLEDIYDVATAIQAFAQLLTEFPTAQLKIAGTGPELSSLESLVKSLKIDASVSFLGRLSVEQMAENYHAADISINPSKVDNTPNSVIESLACGTPVVSTNVGGIPRLVTDKHDALLVDAEQPKLIVSALVCVLNDEVLRNQLITNGKETVAKFQWENVKLLLQDTYSNAIKQNGNK